VITRCDGTFPTWSQMRDPAFAVRLPKPRATEFRSSVYDRGQLPQGGMTTWPASSPHVFGPGLRIALGGADRLMARTGLGRASTSSSGRPPPAFERRPNDRRRNEIPLELVRPNRHQPRTAFDPEGSSELAASISRHGVLQPIVVSADGEGYELRRGAPTRPARGSPAAHHDPGRRPG